MKPKNKKNEKEQSQTMRGKTYAANSPALALAAIVIGSPLRPSRCALRLISRIARVADETTSIVYETGTQEAGRRAEHSDSERSPRALVCERQPITRYLYLPSVTMSVTQLKNSFVICAIYTIYASRSVLLLPLIFFLIFRSLLLAIFVSLGDSLFGFRHHSIYQPIDRRV